MLSAVAYLRLWSLLILLYMSLPILSIFYNILGDRLWLCSHGCTLTVNSNVIEGSGAIKFSSTSALSGSDVGWSGLTGDLFGNVQSGDSYFFRVNGTTEVEIDADGIDVRNGWYEGTEIAAPSGLSNHFRIYGIDNGAGKTKLMVQFGTGAAQQIAIEP